MEIEAIKKLKKELQEDIIGLVARFERRTGLTIEDIDYEHAASVTNSDTEITLFKKINCVIKL